MIMLSRGMDYVDQALGQLFGYARDVWLQAQCCLDTEILGRCDL